MAHADPSIRSSADPRVIAADAEQGLTVVSELLSVPELGTKLRQEHLGFCIALGVVFAPVPARSPVLQGQRKSLN